ncbi:MAG TPA: DUF389 domain-containing protein [Gemmatimonadales bacterium]|nr:DUF389 domain-containing protein [Gemmatimonadales bacterium]
MTQAVPPEPTSWAAALRLLRRLVRPLQARAADACGVDASSRIGTVEQMLDQNARRAPGYWIQLSLAAGIAILGLVLNSTAVVIGAMLVSPLMGPLVELGMGFAVGSSYLLIRSALRVVTSVVVVVIGTALFTIVLPFHEVTAEIASRTAPTALDLLVAVFCALTAAYTTVRRTSDTTAAAAGTAIGIALVPPLCVIGYGVGTLDAQVAGGAALLFTANFSAIVVFSVLAFLLLGYDLVDATVLETQALSSRATRFDRVAARGQEVLARLFGSRFGPAARILVPVAFLAAVYFPLRSALQAVTWQIQRRAEVASILGELVPDAVQQSVLVEKGRVEVRLLVVEDEVDPVAMEARLSTAIAAATGVEPVVQVVAVPDIAALARARSAQSAPASTLPAVAVPAVEQARNRLGSTLARAWPLRGGRLAGWILEVPPDGEPVVVVHHFGAPIGQAAEDLLAEALSSSLDVRPRIVDQPIDSIALLGGADLPAWLRRVDGQLALLPWLDRVSACLGYPRADSAAALADSLRARASRFGERVRVGPDTAWQFQWVSGACPVARADSLVRPGTSTGP